MKNLLVKYIQTIFEESHMREADITGGKKAPWGSKKHLKDLETRIAELTSWRDKQRKGSENRANYSRLINKLKAEYKSAKRHSEKQLQEGGAVGHLMHLYDNPDLTFSEIKEILSTAAEGNLESVSEKFDGMNLVISWDVQADDLRAARAAGDIKRGGMNAEEIAAKFFGRGNVGEAFNSAFKVLHDAIGSLPEKTKTKIFGPNANRWYSIEVIYTENPNVINYDANSVVFHGSPVLEIKDGIVAPAEKLDGVDLLKSKVASMQKAVTLRNWQVRGPSIINMKKLSDGSILSKALSEIDAAMSQAGVSDGDTVQDYLISLLNEEVESLGLQPNVAKAVVDRCIGAEGAPSLIAIKKMVPKDLYESVSEFVKNSPSLLGQLVQPIENAIHEFSIEVLRGLKSTLVDDSDTEVLRLRSEVDKAIKAIESSGQDAAMEILNRQMQKLGNLENISAAMEGVVFIYKGNAYKFTGGFAPANSILGLFKYGRRGIKLNLPN